jgi:hypothetical protein
VLSRMRSWVGFDPRNQQKKTKSGQVLGRKETGQGGKRRTRGPNPIRVFLWRRFRCRGGRKDMAREAHEANAAHHSGGGNTTGPCQSSGGDE